MISYISKPKLQRKVPSKVDKRNARKAQEFSVRLSSPMISLDRRPASVI